MIGKQVHRRLHQARVLLLVDFGMLLDCSHDGVENTHIITPSMDSME